eukprot:g21609.t1
MEVLPREVPSTMLDKDPTRLTDFRVHTKAPSGGAGLWNWFFSESPPAESDLADAVDSTSNALFSAPADHDSNNGHRQYDDEGGSDGEEGEGGGGHMTARHHTEHQESRPAKGAEDENTDTITSIDAAVALKPLITFPSEGDRSYWMSDASARVCGGCSLEFTFLRRRHHCRLCGRVFCQSCSANSVDGRPFGHSRGVRVCNHCFELVQAAFVPPLATPAAAFIPPLATPAAAFVPPLASPAAAFVPPLASPAAAFVPPLATPAAAFSPLLLRRLQPLFPLLLRRLQPLFPLLLCRLQPLFPLLLRRLQPLFPLLLRRLQPLFPLLLRRLQPLFPLLLRRLQPLFPLLLRRLAFVPPLASPAAAFVPPLACTLIAHHKPVPSSYQNHFES